MAFGGSGRRKNGTTSFFVQAVLVILLIWLLFLGITLALTLRFSLNTMQEKTDNGLSSVAESLAASVAVRRAFREGVCSPELMEYLDCLVEKTEDLDISGSAAPLWAATSSGPWRGNTIFPMPWAPWAISTAISVRCWRRTAASLAL